MGVNISFKTSLMFICFGSAVVLFSAARPEPKLEHLIPKQPTPKPKVASIARIKPVLTKAIAAISYRIVVDLSLIHI